MSGLVSSGRFWKSILISTVTFCIPVWPIYGLFKTFSLPVLISQDKKMDIHITCDALPQNREQVAFWVKWVFVIIVRGPFSFNLVSKSGSYFLRYDHLCKDRKLFLWKCDFEKSAFKISYLYKFESDRLQKMQNFLWENVWKSVRNYMEVIENI